MADYYRDVIRLLKDHGYEFKRQAVATTKSGGIRAPASMLLSIESCDPDSPPMES
jgi:hypothetical protein